MMFQAETERDRIAAQATEWVLRLDSGADHAVRTAANSWIAEHPAHAVAFVEAEAAWQDSRRLRSADTLLRPDPSPADEQADRTVAARRGPSRRAVVGGALAASVAAAVGIGLHLRGGEVFRTVRGQRSHKVLADGSSVALNTDSAIQFRLDADRRFVRLVRGEALFDVRRDVSRPFIVDVGDARIEVLGTSFNIRVKDDVTELTVTEGIVSVRDQERKETKVSANSTALIRGGIVTTTALDANLLHQRVAWNEGFIELNGEPLEQALVEVNRYRTIPLVIGDPRIASVSVAGRFGIEETDNFIKALEAGFHIRPIKSDGKEIVLVLDRA